MILTLLVIGFLLVTKSSLPDFIEFFENRKGAEK